MNPWHAWRLRATLRRLTAHARQEGAEPPPDLLARLRADIPPDLARPLDASRRLPEPGNLRDGWRPRWALAAASLALVATAGLVALRVERNEASRPPASAAALAGAARASLAGPGDAARGDAGPPGGTVGAVAKAAPAGAAARDSLRATGTTPAAPFPAAPRSAARGAQPTAPAPPPTMSASMPLVAPAAPMAAMPPTLPQARLARQEAPRPLRSTFGAGTGTTAYDLLRDDLLGAGRLPAPGTLRLDQLANAFAPQTAAASPSLAVAAPARARAARREGLAPGAAGLEVEGARLPVAGRVYLLRLTARGLAAPIPADAVEVDFDPAVVLSARRVGATATAGSATALYEVELRSNPPPRASATFLAALDARRNPGTSAPAAPAAPAPTTESAMNASGSSVGAAAPPEEAEDASRPAAAESPARAESSGTVAKPARSRLAEGTWAPPVAAPAPNTPPPSAVASSAASSPSQGRSNPSPAAAALAEPAAVDDLVLATLRAAGLPPRVVRVGGLRSDWEQASASLRLQGLAVQLAEVASARPMPVPTRWLQLRAEAAALAVELPGDPRAAELRHLVERAIELAGLPPAP